MYVHNAIWKIWSERYVRIRVWRPYTWRNKNRTHNERTQNKWTLTRVSIAVHRNVNISYKHFVHTAKLLLCMGSLTDYLLWWKPSFNYNSIDAIFYAKSNSVGVFRLMECMQRCEILAIYVANEHFGWLMFSVWWSHYLYFDILDTCWRIEDINSSQWYWVAHTEWKLSAHTIWNDCMWIHNS